MDLLNILVVPDLVSYILSLGEVRHNDIIMRIQTIARVRAIKCMKTRAAEPIINYAKIHANHFCPYII